MLLVFLSLFHNEARNPLSKLRSKPKKSATWPRWSTPQKPSVSPRVFVHSNQGIPNAPDLNAWEVFDAKRSFTSGSVDCPKILSQYDAVAWLSNWPIWDWDIQPWKLPLPRPSLVLVPTPEETPQVARFSHCPRPKTSDTRRQSLVWTYLATLGKLHKELAVLLA